MKMREKLKSKIQKRKIKEFCLLGLVVPLVVFLISHQNDGTFTFHPEIFMVLMIAAWILLSYTVIYEMGGE
jgi:heme/copper-type cytochrome/quinol oxidase subunit 4